MKALLQRVSSASVEVEGETVGKIDAGFLVLLGVGPDDEKSNAEILARKVIKLRVFEDEAGKMNRSLEDEGGDLLVVSQFTLYADTRKGNRPSYTTAAPPDLANELYSHFVSELRQIAGGRVETGRFAAEMKVSLVNEGPVTIMLES